MINNWRGQLSCYRTCIQSICIYIYNKICSIQKYNVEWTDIEHGNNILVYIVDLIKKRIHCKKSSVWFLFSLIKSFAKAGGNVPRGVDKLFVLQATCIDYQPNYGINLQAWYRKTRGQISQIMVNGRIQPRSDHIASRKHRLRKEVKFRN